MIVEIRINKKGNSNWLEIEPIKMFVHNSVDASSFAKAAADANKAEVRWNYENNLNGNYVGSEYKFEEKFEIEKTLVVSTGHITYKDSLQLSRDADNRGGHGKLIVNESMYAWDVYVSSDKEVQEDYEEILKNNYSDAFAKLIEKARELGVHWVKFDQDGQEYKSFEKFEW